MNKILEVKFGSHLYGTNTENSDIDLKGIYLPTAKEIILGNYQRTINISRPKQSMERNTKNDIDIETFSLDRFLQLLMEGQTVALDLLFTNPANIVSITDEGSQIMYEIDTNREKLLHKGVSAFVGYARQQAAKYGVKGFRVAALRSTLEFLSNYTPPTKLHNIKTDLDKFVYPGDLYEGDGSDLLIKYTWCKGPKGIPEQHIEVCNRKLPLHCTVKYAIEVLQKIFDEYGSRALKAEKNEGIDWKALSHAVRVNSEAYELLTMHKITFPRPERELLLQIKKGELPYKDVAVIIETGLDRLLDAQKRSTLREIPDKTWADEFVYKIYSDIVKKSS